MVRLMKCGEKSQKNFFHRNWVMDRLMKFGEKKLEKLFSQQSGDRQSKMCSETGDGQSNEVR